MATRRGKFGRLTFELRADAGKALGPRDDDDNGAHRAKRLPVAVPTSEGLGVTARWDCQLRPRGQQRRRQSLAKPTLNRCGPMTWRRKACATKP